MRQYRFILSALSCLLVCILLMSACGTTSVQTPSTSSEAPVETTVAPTEEPVSFDGVNLNFYTGSTTGTYYPFGGAICLMWNEAYPGLNAMVQSSGGSKANIFALADEECDVALVQSDTAYYAVNGKALFEGEPETGYYALAALYPEVVQGAAVEGVTSAEQLVGLRVSFSEIGSGTNYNVQQILEACGISTSDLTEYDIGPSDSADQIKDGKIDAYFSTGGCPATHITDLLTVKDCDLISIPEEARDYLVENYSFYDKYTIEAGTYESIDYDVETVAVKALLLVNDDMSDELAYALTKALFENTDLIEHAKASYISLDTALDGVSVDLHPGAIKYYQEIGLLP